jgi:hypothetical protein
MTITSHRITTRRMRQQVGVLLGLPDYKTSIEEICRFPYRQVVNPLFSFLYSLDEPIKWRAVSAMGQVVTRLAEERMESARIIMRRFIWNLNDESGGIGWGSAESMGEVTAVSQALADEYARILFSFIRPDENYIELEDLQAGVLWGIGRLAYARPGYLQEAPPFLCAYMRSARAQLRGLAAWAAGALPLQATRTHLESLRTDSGALSLYRGGTLQRLHIGELVASILSQPIELPE